VLGWREGVGSIEGLREPAKSLDDASVRIEDLKESAYPLEEGSVPRKRVPRRRWSLGGPLDQLHKYLRAGVALIVLGFVLVVVGAAISEFLEGCGFNPCIDRGAYVWVAGFATIVLGFVVMVILYPAAARRYWRY